MNRVNFQGDLISTTRWTPTPQQQKSSCNWLQTRCVPCARSGRKKVDVICNRATGGITSRGRHIEMFFKIFLGVFSYWSIFAAPLEVLLSNQNYKLERKSEDFQMWMNIIASVWEQMMEYDEIWWTIMTSWHNLPIVTLSHEVSDGSPDVSPVEKSPEFLGELDCVQKLSCT